LDAAVVELCARCLADAATDDSADRDLALSATALARDLADTQRGEAPRLLDTAWRRALAYLECSDLDARSFATALRRLASLRACANAKLVSSDLHE